MPNTLNAGFFLAAGLLLNLIVFAGIGFGPALYCVCGPRRLATAALLAPALGLALVTVAGTALTLTDLPVSRWTTPLVVVGLSTSLAMAAIVLLSEPSASRPWRRGCGPSLAVVAVLCTVVFSPQLTGGSQFSTLRGDGEDSLNYVTVAGYLDHEPLSWRKTVDWQGLVDRHPTYFRALQSLEGRWAVSMLLAFESRVAGVSSLAFEFTFSVLFAVLSFGPLVLWCREWLGLTRPWALWIAAVVCSGFWAQFVVDVRADAHQAALPLTLAFGVIVLDIEASAAQERRLRAHAALGLVGASILFVYPECAPFLALGVAVFLGLRWRNTLTSLRLRGWALSAAVASGAAFPMRVMLVRFLGSQMQYAATVKNTWEQAYFHWLYSSPLSGAWGLRPFSAMTLGHAIAEPLFVLLGATLTMTLVAALVQAPRRRTDAGLVLASTLSASALLQMAYLYSQGQLWAAGKGLSYGFPFLILAAMAVCIGQPQNGSALWQRLRPIAAVVGVLFLATQSLLAATRPWLAREGIEYPDYIISHAEYRRHHWDDLAPISAALKDNRGATIWSHMTNLWVADFVALSIGWDVNVVQIGTSRDIEDLHAPRQRLDKRPDFLLLDDHGRQAQYASADHRQIVAESAEFVLVRSGDEPVLVDLVNPNGIEGPPQAPFVWLGGGSTSLRVVSMDDGCARLGLQLAFGPSKATAGPARLSLSNDRFGSLGAISVSEGRQSLEFRIARGINILQIHVDDPVGPHLPQDPRPLMVRADAFDVRTKPCSLASRLNTSGA